MTLIQLIHDLERLMPHARNEEVEISVPDRVGKYAADYARITVKGVEIVASEPVSSKNRTTLSR